MSSYTLTIVNRIWQARDRARALCLLAIGSLAACSDPGGANGTRDNVAAGAGGGSAGSTSPGAGGTAGTAPGTGGAAGTGGASTPGGGTSGSGGGPPVVVECSITVTSSSPSADIATVGIVEFTTDLSGVSSGRIQFGLSTDYGLEAPVDLGQAGYRTLLLGMTQDSTYHYRIELTAGSTVCTSADQTLTTGFLPNGGPSDLTPQAGESAAPVANGFIITSSGLSGPWIYIVNQDGDLVWAFDTGSTGGGGPGPGGFNGITRARMSWDGKHMYGRDLNVSGESNAGRLFKIAMDGSSMQTFDLDSSHHDFTVTPDNGVAYLSKQGASGEGNEPCDAIRKRSADGSSDVIVYDLWDALADFQSQSSLGELCHANAIDYIEADDSFTVSDLYRDVILKVTAAGTLQWTLGGSDGGFTGNGVEWNDQHGHHLFDPNQILIFNNGGMNGPSRAIGFQLDTSGMTATANFEYEPGADSGQLGDVQRLPNGNTLITFSVSGQMHEVDSAQQRIRSFSSNSFGYADYRATLYGPPTRR